MYNWSNNSAMLWLVREPTHEPVQNWESDWSHEVDDIALEAVCSKLFWNKNQRNQICCAQEEHFSYILYYQYL